MGPAFGHALRLEHWHEQTPREPRRRTIQPATPPPAGFCGEATNTWITTSRQIGELLALIEQQRKG